MNYSYNRLLSVMRDKYTELSGLNVEDCSDIGIRLQLLAGELYSLNRRIEWLENQMFPDTAAGEGLERHAAQRGLERYRGSKARGSILFALDMPLEFKVTIPKGTVCSNSAGTLRYRVDRDCMIEKGESFAFVPATAEKSGAVYNVPQDTITTVITYFSVGLRVRNSSAFAGGTDDESDEELRKRVLDSLKNIPNGANEEFFLSLAKSVEGVYSARMYDHPMGVGKMLYISGMGRGVGDNVLHQVEELVNEQKPVGIAVVVLNVRTETCAVGLQLHLEDGWEMEDVSSRVRLAVKDYFDHLENGEGVKTAALGGVVMSVDGVANCRTAGTEDTEGTKGVLYVLGDVTITEY